MLIRRSALSPEGNFPRLLSCVPARLPSLLRGSCHPAGAPSCAHPTSRVFSAADAHFNRAAPTRFADGRGHCFTDLPTGHTCCAAAHSLYQWICPILHVSRGQAPSRTVQACRLCGSGLGRSRQAVHTRNSPIAVSCGSVGTGNAAPSSRNR
jgi:hypothetical protein